MDKYTRIRLLGKGSFGNAILIKRRKDNALFVIKEVFLGKMNHKEREEARHECRILQKLDHPNIVRYVEHFEKGNNLYIVMEYCDGGDLHAKVKNGPLKEGVILYYFSQICLAMEYLHTRYILHRDIKTMNVFLMKNGSVKLGDFGISTVLRNTMGLANTVCGTPYYFSPEICRNKPYNNKSDVWALGVLLYQLATGRHPFDGNSMQQLMQRIVKGSCPQLPSRFSREFRQMVQWCLQKDPAQRPSIRQTLSLPVVRQALEQLEENLMLATQCRVRLRDIIDFETDSSKSSPRKRHQQEEQQKHRHQPQAPSPSQFVGVSPGKAAALALADQQHKQQNCQPQAEPQSHAHAQAQAQEQLRRAMPVQAVVGPKPSENPVDLNRIEKYRRHLIEQYQRRAEPISSPANNAYANANANAKEKAAEAHNRHHAPVAANSYAHENVAPAKNAHGNVHASDAAGNQREAAGFEARMARVNAIMQRYAQNVDPKARETIHAYMRRKQEEYAQEKKKQHEWRRVREEMRQRELRRVIEHQNRRMPRGGEYPRPEKADKQAKRHRISPQKHSRAHCPPSQPQPQPHAAVFGRDPRCVARPRSQRGAKPSLSRPRVLAANSLRPSKDPLVDYSPGKRLSPPVVESQARDMAAPDVSCAPHGCRHRSAPPRPLNGDGHMRHVRKFHHVDPLSPPGPVRSTQAAGFGQPRDEIPAAVEARRRFFSEQRPKPLQQPVPLSEVRMPQKSPLRAVSIGAEARYLQWRRNSADQNFLDATPVSPSENDVQRKKSNEKEKVHTPVALSLAPLQVRGSPTSSPFFSRGERSPSSYNTSQNAAAFAGRAVGKKSYPPLPSRNNNTTSVNNGDNTANAVQPQIPSVIGMKAPPQPRVEAKPELSPVLVHVDYAVSHCSPKANDAAPVNVNVPSTTGPEPAPNANLRLPLLSDAPAALANPPDIAQQWNHAADKPAPRAPARHPITAPHSIMQEALTRPEEQEILAAYQRPLGDAGARQVIPSTLEVLQVSRESEGEDARGMARQDATAAPRRPGTPLVLLKQQKRNTSLGLQIPVPIAHALPDLIGSDQATASPRASYFIENSCFGEKAAHAHNSNNSNGEWGSSPLGESPRGDANAEERDALLAVLDDSAEEGEKSLLNVSTGEVQQEKSLDAYMAMLEHLRGLLHGARPPVATATKRTPEEKEKKRREKNVKECSRGQIPSKGKENANATDILPDLCERTSRSISSADSPTPCRVLYTKVKHDSGNCQMEEKQKQEPQAEEQVAPVKRETGETKDCCENIVDGKGDSAKAESDHVNAAEIEEEDDDDDDEEEEDEKEEQHEEEEEEVEEDEEEDDDGDDDEEEETEETEEEEDDDFEDAIPLSPVRCTNVNDTYRRMLVNN